MKNLRTFVLQPEAKKTFDPVVMTQKLLEAGFSFDHIGCPVKITQPWDRLETDDGCVVFRQWDE